MGHAKAGRSSTGAGEDKKEAQLLSVSWNQDNTCFTAATTADFRVFICHPNLKESLRRVHEDGGGFAIAEMLFQSNIFATVASGGDGAGREQGSRDRFRVEVWDDVKHRRLWQCGHPNAVRGVRVSSNRLAVALDRMVKVYDLWRPPRLVCKVETAPNPLGLCCLSCRSDELTVLACPGTVPGQVRVEHLDEGTTRFIAAHSSDVACMAMTLDGTVLATASVKGTLIRVFSTVDGTCLQEVRRGLDNADIYSIALSRELQWLAVSSDKGTVHVFSLRFRVAGKKDAADMQSPAAPLPLVPTNTVSNAKSSLSFMKGFLPNYFSSEWSFAQFHVREDIRSMVAFGQHNTVMIVGMDASFYRCSFDTVKGGEMVLNEYFRFLNDKNTPEIETLITR